jgi:hypothetical protein
VCGKLEKEVVGALVQRPTNSKHHYHGQN